MIKIFRHIRKSLLMENKSGKYFKYAIGEIALVMIGILLALQVNNWNENKKAEVFEKNILKEIHKTLNDDLILFEALEERIKNKDTAIDNLLLVRKGRKTLTDNELRLSVIWSRAGILFSYNSGPYEALKSSGLDKIKSDSLRFALTNYYEVTIPRAEFFIQDDKERFMSLKNVEYNRLKDLGFYENYFEFNENDEGYEGYRPKIKYNLEKYINDPSYNKTLLLESDYKVDMWRNIKAIIKRTEALNEIVKLELKTRFNEN